MFPQLSLWSILDVDLIRILRHGREPARAAICSGMQPSLAGVLAEAPLTRSLRTQRKSPRKAAHESGVLPSASPSSRFEEHASSASSRLSVVRRSTALWILDIFCTAGYPPSSNSSKRDRRDAGDLLVLLSIFSHAMATGDLFESTRIDRDRNRARTC